VVRSLQKPISGSSSALNSPVTVRMTPTSAGETRGVVPPPASPEA
jgi:hypothetical protein